jgi:hypothetical protein
MSRKGQSLPVMFYLLRPLWVKTRQLQSEKQRPMTLNRDREKPILVMYLYVRRVPKSGRLILMVPFSVPRLPRGYSFWLSPLFARVLARALELRKAGDSKRHKVLSDRVLLCIGVNFYELGRHGEISLRKRVVGGSNPSAGTSLLTTENWSGAFRSASR